MGSKLNVQLHILLFPLMAPGHMIPIADMAKLFALRGVKITIVATPLNPSFFTKSIQKTEKLGFEINIHTLKFHTVEAGLPQECENLDFITSQEMGREMISKFFVGLKTLQEPLEKLLQAYRPDCLIADMFFPWATDSAAKFGIPRLVFHGTSYFSLCTGDCLRLHEPHKKVSSDSEPFLVPELPGDIKLTINELPAPSRLDSESDFYKLFKQVEESNLSSYGVIVNSCYELEPDYADFYKNSLGRKSWHVGPVSLCNKDVADKAGRGKEASIDEYECMKWLNSKKANSVVYVCFGSMSHLSVPQLKEIAKGLEASGQPFIWVVRREKKNQEDEEDWLSEGFEERLEGKGLIIRGWAPQVLILDHEAVGGFVTHCGWNSTLEGITAGKAMITWPLGAEQFFNEKLVTQVLKIGISLRATLSSDGECINSEDIGKAVTQIVVGEEAEEMGRNAKALGEMARKAVEEGGSSYSSFTALIEELKLKCC